MHKSLLISDIHGNIAALNAIIAYADKHYPGYELWCLGDVVGYGPSPFLVWSRLRSVYMPDGGWLAGNHDWGLLGKLPRYKLLKPNPKLPESCLPDSE